MEKNQTKRVSAPDLCSCDKSTVHLSVMKEHAIHGLVQL